ncbi:permease [Alteromonas gilva]|uniref:Permease n=1 Tax=Alteromonas gilva TaxID=2987522 RepID=A0ABT5KYM3_9ALTE|nr:permease [Alteromonas gilva]MDC8829878.1 permease [Alteromonas gilva]
MTQFLQDWHEAATTSLGFFWMALWAFMLGYFVSSLIQVLVTRERMQKTMGKDGPKSIALGTFFGFISSSCSFAALATTRTLFKKGAGLAPSMAFLLASTNLVIELGMVIAVFLGWQFVSGEYVGGVLLILFSWALIRITRPKRLVEQTRQRLADDDTSSDEGGADWKQTLTSQKGWQKIGMKYVMEWQMVWKDVLIGFTVAGIISAFVPTVFFETLFIGSGGDNAANPGFLAVLVQTIVAPFAAFFTFIGSMGNIPLAAVLFGQGVAFAGVMAFIFSDLVVLPVLRINAQYYGWKMALYMLIVMLVAIVASALLMHYVLVFFDALPNTADAIDPGNRDFFAINYQFYLNLGFMVVSAVMLYFFYQMKKMQQSDSDSTRSVADVIMLSLSAAAVLWLVGGAVVVPAF